MLSISPELQQASVSDMYTKKNSVKQNTTVIRRDQWDKFTRNPSQYSHIIPQKSESHGLEKFWVGLLMDYISRRAVLMTVLCIFFPLHTLFLNFIHLTGVRCDPILWMLKKQIQCILLSYKTNFRNFQWAQISISV